jgi:hypothetical protein
VTFVDEGIALGVYNEKDFTPTLKKLLEKNLELAENRKKYIKKYLHKVDGKATERVVKIVKDKLDKKKN